MKSLFCLAIASLCLFSVGCADEHYVVDSQPDVYISQPQTIVEVPVVHTEYVYVRGVRTAKPIYIYKDGSRSVTNTPRRTVVSAPVRNRFSTSSNSPARTTNTTVKTTTTSSGSFSRVAPSTTTVQRSTTSSFTRTSPSYSSFTSRTSTSSGNYGSFSRSSGNYGSSSSRR